MPPPAWTVIFTVTAIVYLGVGVGVPWYYQVAQPVYMIPVDPPQQDVPAQAQAPPALAIENHPSSCPVQRYLERHYCEGESTARNALRCALRRLRRWEDGGGGPVPSLVTVFTGPANYEEIIDPDNLRPYCETDVRQTVWKCNTMTDSAGRRPSCRKMRTKCFVRHSLPEGHFQFPQDLDCEGGPPS